MSKLLTIIGGLTAGTAVVGGTATYFLTKENTKPLFKEQFSHSLIALDGKEDNLLKEKLKHLHTNQVKSDNAKLKDAKSKTTGTDDKGLAELKQACQEIYDSNFVNRGLNIFKDFVAYCSKNIKDEITADKWAPDASDFSWAPKLEALKSPNKILVSSLDKIAKKSPGATNEELKGWCESVQNLLFEDPQDNTFKNANEFCTKDN